MSGLQTVLVAMMIATMVAAAVVHFVAPVSVTKKWFWRLHLLASILMAAVFWLAIGVENPAFLATVGALGMSLWMTSRVRYCICGSVVAPQGLRAADYCPKCGAALESTDTPGSPPPSTG